MKVDPLGTVWLWSRGSACGSIHGDRVTKIVTPGVALFLTKRLGIHLSNLTGIAATLSCGIVLSV